MQRRPLRDTGSEALAIARDVWRRSRGAILRTPGLLVLSLLLGIALWITVTDAENPTRVDVFPASIAVEAVNVGRPLALANALQTVEVRLSAAADRWEGITSDNLHAVVDLNGRTAREQRVPVQVDVRGIGGVRVVSVSPSSIVVNLEDFVTREVPVTARLVGVVPPGYEVTSAQPASATVEVAGPESLVALVQEAVADVNVTGLTVGFELTVNLAPRGEGGGEIRGVRLDPATLRVAVEVDQTTVERLLPLQPTVAGEPAPGYRITAISVLPATARVLGTIDVLQSVDSIRLPQLDIAGASGEIRRTVAITPPEGARLSESGTATVIVSIAAVAGSLRLSVPVQAVNVPEGLVPRFETQSVSVLLRGPLPVLGALDGTDVTATVDLDGLAAGTVTVPVVVQATAEVVVDAVQPSAVSVTLVLAP